MIVKGVAVDPAVFNNIADADLLSGFSFKSLIKERLISRSVKFAIGDPPKY